MVNEILIEKLRDLRNAAASGHPPGWQLMANTVDKR
jgi:hypothetical protein